MNNAQEFNELDWNMNSKDHFDEVAEKYEEFCEEYGLSVDKDPEELRALYNMADWLSISEGLLD